MTEQERLKFIKLIPYSTMNQLFKFAKLEKYDFDIVYSLIGQCAIDYVYNEKLGLEVGPEEET